MGNDNPTITCPFWQKMLKETHHLELGIQFARNLVCIYMLLNFQIESSNERGMHLLPLKEAPDDEVYHHHQTK